MKPEPAGYCDSRSRSPRGCRETPIAASAVSAAASTQQELCREDRSRSPHRDAGSSTAGVSGVNATDAAMLKAASSAKHVDVALCQQHTLQEVLHECLVLYSERPSARIFMKLHTAIFAILKPESEAPAGSTAESKSTAAKLVDDTFTSELQALHSAVHLMADGTSANGTDARALLQTMRSGRRRLYILQCMWALHKELRNLHESQTLGDEPLAAVRARLPALWPRLLSRIVRGRLGLTSAELGGLVAAAARFGRRGVLGERLPLAPGSLGELEGADKVLRLHLALQLCPRARRFLVDELLDFERLGSLAEPRAEAEASTEPSTAEPQPPELDVPASKRRSPTRARRATVPALQPDIPAARRLMQQAPSIWATIIMRWLPKESLFEIAGLC